MSNNENRQVWLSQMSARPGLIPSLDGLRATAILLVVLSHIVRPTWIEQALGVTIFFFISGFLITRLLLAEGKENGAISLIAFYARRLLRLYPALLVFLAAVLIYVAAIGHEFSSVEFAAGLFYFTNYFTAWLEINGGQSSLPASHLWSLAVEEHFYLLFPLLLMIVRVPASRVKAALVVIVGCLVLRVIYLLAVPGIAGMTVIQQNSETRFDSIAYGCLLALMCEVDRGRAVIRFVSRPAFLWLAVVVIAAIAYRGLLPKWFDLSLRYSFQGVALFVVVAGILFSPGNGWLKRLLNHPIAVWIGTISYSLYLWHVLVIVGGERWLPVDRPAQIAIEFTLSFAAAALSFYLVERPFRALRNRLRPRPGAETSDRGLLPLRS